MRDLEPLRDGRPGLPAAVAEGGRLEYPASPGASRHVHNDWACRRDRHGGHDVGAGGGGETPRLSQLGAIEVPDVNVPPAALELRPGDPEPALPVRSNRGVVEDAGLRDVGHGLPCLVRHAGEHELLAAGHLRLGPVRLDADGPDSPLRVLDEQSALLARCLQGHAGADSDGDARPGLIGLHTNGPAQELGEGELEALHRRVEGELGLRRAIHHDDHPVGRALGKAAELDGGLGEVGDRLRAIHHVVLSEEQLPALHGELSVPVELGIVAPTPFHDDTDGCGEQRRREQTGQKDRRETAHGWLLYSPMIFTRMRLGRRPSNSP